MASLYILIPIALIFCVIVIRLLLWAIDSGQYDDLDKEAWRILAPEDKPERESTQMPETETETETETEKNDH
ncbi:cbb3-type cytochrome oxidase assembly protein CcoS [Kineobactrum sediminis]|uniref:Cbb3-type cytochrome oxidase assembly protein CcoS n=1 Tax=Kineobactrum sediminis TaxID=1905677 RepID=A0A2N5Y401_9GAMM|nr:cbb3-type cytochrome oxidase assembly protein CcoS [Kineobactrum sediminis]PLW83131.1 cbb3-type cytochrome oxidase assembly protein CcoS [Kineobactrum sediminis]